MIPIEWTLALIAYFPWPILRKGSVLALFFVTRITEVSGTETKPSRYLTAESALIDDSIGPVKLALLASRTIQTHIGLSVIRIWVHVCLGLAVYLSSDKGILALITLVYCIDGHCVFLVLLVEPRSRFHELIIFLSSVNLQFVKTYLNYFHHQFFCGFVESPEICTVNRKPHLGLAVRTHEEAKGDSLRAPLSLQTLLQAVVMEEVVASQLDYWRFCE